MFKKFLCIIVAVVILTLCGCQKDTGEGGAFVFPISEPLSYLDPQIVSGSSGRIAVKNCFEGLVRQDENGTIKPAAAEKWSVSDDGRVYTFTLRQDAVWYIPNDVELYNKQKGEETIRDVPVLEVTANDFVFAFRRAVNPQTQSAYARSLSKIKNAEEIIKGTKSVTSLGAEAVDKYTLKITLTGADEDFLYVLTTPVCMPCNEEFFEKTGGRYGINDGYLIYNGPFYISSWSSNSSATLKPNSSYNGAFAAKPASVYLSLNSNSDSWLEKLENGTYDAAPISEDQTAEVGTQGGVRVYSFKKGIKGFIFNCSDESLKNKNLRKALLYSLDVSSVNGGLAVDIVPDACIASGANYRDVSGGLVFPTADSRQAVKNWKTGLKKLDTSSVSITILCSTDDEITVRRIMQQWQSDFGISADIKCEAVEGDELVTRVEKGSYQLAYAGIYLQTEYASDFLMRFTADSPNNTARLNDKKYDALMLEAVKARGTDRLVSVLHSAEQYLLDNGIIIPTGDIEFYYATAKGVSGVSFGINGELIDFSQGVKFD